MKVLNKSNIVKCGNCGSFLQYSQSDVFQQERGYDVGTYYGETYIANLITCPVCGAKIEI